MKQRNVLLGGVGLVLALIAVYVVADRWFLPEESTRVDKAGPGPGAAPTRVGSSASADSLHSVSGRVSLYEGNGTFLRFEDYDATPGPDVYFYLTLGHAVADGARLLVPGGEEGHATLRGNFNVPLEIDPSAFDTVLVWCDRFDVEFGSAMLTPS